jgi:AraC-like DNA-binding protein
MDFIKKNLDTGLLHQILDSFVDLTGIKASYYDEYLQLISGKDQDNCAFCNEIKKYPELKKNCAQSDKGGLQKAQDTKDMNLYKCHMGLWEAVVPVLVDDKAAGLLMLGQVKGREGGLKAWEKIKAELESINVTKDEIAQVKRAYDDIEETSEDKIKAAAKMLGIIAQFIAYTEAVKICEMEVIQKIKKYIDSNYRDHISPVTIAAKVNFSPSYISYLFKRETGSTITHYAESQRLKQAKELLTKTSFSIKEVAFKSGFSDQNYFSRFFKKYEKMSPKRYREEKTN